MRYEAFASRPIAFVPKLGIDCSDIVKNMAQIGGVLSQVLFQIEPIDFLEDYPAKFRELWAYIAGTAISGCAFLDPPNAKYPLSVAHAFGFLIEYEKGGEYRSHVAMKILKAI
jgi:hypothetical protein